MIVHLQTQWWPSSSDIDMYGTGTGRFTLLVLKPVYFCQIGSIPWLLMTWLLCRQDISSNGIDYVGWPSPCLPSGLILGLSLADERRRYFVTASLIGWAQAWNQPCSMGKNFWKCKYIIMFCQQFCWGIYIILLMFPQLSICQVARGLTAVIGI